MPKKAAVKLPEFLALFSVQDLVRGLGVRHRLIRYVLDRRIVDPRVFAPRDRVARGKGRHQRFSVPTAVLLAFAAWLMESGVHGPLVRQVVRELLRWVAVRMRPARVTMFEQVRLLSLWSQRITVEVTDGGRMRILVDAKKFGVGPPHGLVGSGWVSLDSGKAVVAGDAPVVTIRVRLGDVAVRMIGGVYAAAAHRAT